MATLKVFFLLSGTEISLERRVKETPAGESTARPRGRLLIQSLVVGSSLRIWTSTTSRYIVRKQTFLIEFLVSVQHSSQHATPVIAAMLRPKRWSATLIPSCREHFRQGMKLIEQNKKENTRNAKNQRCETASAHLQACCSFGYALEIQIFKRVASVVGRREFLFASIKYLL